MLRKKVSASESAWFSEKENILLLELKKKHEREQKEREKLEKDKTRKALKEAHWMKCPKCGHDMKHILVEKIEVDQCKECEGLYFDAGELDSLLLAKENNKKKFFHKLFTLSAKHLKS